MYNNKLTIDEDVVFMTMANELVCMQGPASHCSGPEDSYMERTNAALPLSLPRPRRPAFMAAP